MIARRLLTRGFCSSSAAASAVVTPIITVSNSGDILVEGFDQPIPAAQILSKRDRRELLPVRHRQGPARKLILFMESQTEHLTRPQIWKLTNKEENPDSGFFDTRAQLNDCMQWMKRHNWITPSLNPKNRKMNRVWKPIPKPARNVAPIWAMSMDKAGDAEAEVYQKLLKVQEAQAVAKALTKANAPLSRKAAIRAAAAASKQ